MFVTFTGFADHRTLTPQDFQALGTSNPSQIVFLRNEPVEVPDELGQLLVSDPRLGGSFVAFTAPASIPEGVQLPEGLLTPEGLLPAPEPIPGVEAPKVLESDPEVEQVRSKRKA
jgi:hypothetical protein